MTYNDTVTKYNRTVRQFPDSIVANILHFSPKDYLQEPQGKTDMPSMAI
jgi:LemA protein